MGVSTLQTSDLVQGEEKSVSVTLKPAGELTLNLCAQDFGVSAPTKAIHQERSFLSPNSARVCFSRSSAILNLLP